MSSPDTSHGGTKYSVSRTSRWRWQHDHDRPRLSDHALQRWDDRAGAGAVAPETAWIHGRDAEHLDTTHAEFTDCKGNTTDTLRVYRGKCDGERYLMVFVVNDGTVTTVVTPDEYPGPVRAYINAQADLVTPADSQPTPNGGA